MSAPVPELPLTAPQSPHMMEVAKAERSFIMVAVADATPTHANMMTEVARLTHAVPAEEATKRERIRSHGRWALTIGGLGVTLVGAWMVPEAVPRACVLCVGIAAVFGHEVMRELLDVAKKKLGGP